MSNGIGSNIWWTVPELAKDGKAVQGILGKYGFGEKDMPLPNKRMEVSRAVASFHNLRTKEDKRITISPKENDREVVYAILDCQRESSDEVSFNQGTTVRLSKIDDTVSIEGKLVSDVQFQLEVYKGKITDDDVRAFLGRVISKCRGVAKRPTGGIYFIPDKYTAVIESAQKALAEIDGGAKLYVEGVVNGVQERQNVWDSVESEIETELARTLDSVERIGRSANAVKNHQAKLDGVKELMDVYVGLLGEEAKYQDIAAKIESAVKVTSVKISELQNVSNKPVRRRKSSSLGQGEFRMAAVA